MLSEDEDAFSLKPRHSSLVTAFNMAFQRQLLRGSVVVGFFSLLSAFSGILVETSIAAQLGLSKSSDSFYAAFTIPYILTNLFSATSQFSLVPFFSTLDSRDFMQDLGRGLSYVLNLMFLGLGLFALVGAFAAPWMMRAIAPGFTRPQVELATQLGRWLFLVVVPAGIAEVFRSFLLSRHSFVLSSAAGFIRNIVVILVILRGFDRLGPFSIVLGYLLGYLLQMLVLGLQIAISFPVRYSLTLTGSGEAFRRLRGAGTAQVGGALAWQVEVLAERMIASFLPAGTLTAVNYGSKILYTMVELLGGSVGTAALPQLARDAMGKTREVERKTFKDIAEISLFFTSPPAVFCLMLSHNIIRLVFERGHFTPAATGLMSRVFFYYCLSLVPLSFLRLLTFYLFARVESGAFLRLSILLYSLNLGFDLFYVGVLHLGARGIPLGLLMASVIVCALCIRRNLGDLRQALGRAELHLFGRNLLAAALTALAIGALRPWVTPPHSALQNLLHLVELCSAGSLAYMAALTVLRASPLAFRRSGK
jgi:putative peptidoglycan lipid II flippase